MAGMEVSFHSYHQQLYIKHTVVESEIAGEGGVAFGVLGWVWFGWGVLVCYSEGKAVSLPITHTK